MNLYFYDQAGDQDPSNSTNWWDATGGPSGGGTNAYLPSSSDDCFIDAGQTCSSSSFNYLSLTVNGTISSNSYKVIDVNNGVVFDNFGTVATNFGTVTNNKTSAYVTFNSSSGVVTNNESGATVSDNAGQVTNNNGTITNRLTYGLTVNEFEGADIPSAYNVGTLYASIVTNSGTITNTDSIASVGVNNGLISTNSGSVVSNDATVTTNLGAIGTNNSTVTLNSGTITTNASFVTNNNGTITTNSGSGFVVSNNGNILVSYGSIGTNSSGLNLNSGSVTLNDVTGLISVNAGSITTNNGSAGIGSITGGTGNIRASTPTNLSSHTAGLNVTFPTTPINWW